MLQGQAAAAVIVTRVQPDSASPQHIMRPWRHPASCA